MYLGEEPPNQREFSLGPSEGSGVQDLWGITKPRQREFLDCKKKSSEVWAIAGAGLDRKEANGQAGAMVKTRPATFSIKA